MFCKKTIFLGFFILAPTFMGVTFLLMASHLNVKEQPRLPSKKHRPIYDFKCVNIVNENRFSTIGNIFQVPERYKIQ